MASKMLILQIFWCLSLCQPVHRNRKYLLYSQYQLNNDTMKILESKIENIKVKMMEIDHQLTSLKQETDSKISEIKDLYLTNPKQTTNAENMPEIDENPQNLKERLDALENKCLDIGRKVKEHSNLLESYKVNMKKIKKIATLQSILEEQMDDLE
ncbi:hypothetical protein EDEG_02151 [Edhazardia aedis USNM 41457]|uniref:Uncharacterized protein n=1 Tax=Edhazardia aedis (strain USNM 41457) TaxID=1003232 RepID=J9DLR1_EDHAE|nr:hypothetical protein EDEG_02151 [Edhazardia aedis USNM 41457]|eukprot:EJW03530.1 hypothetical protein EDEG_02151 [Edhazardia aedis USNM 41457]